MSNTAENLHEIRTSLQADVTRQYPSHPISSLTHSTTLDQFALPDARDPQVLKDYFMISFLLNSDQISPITLRLKQTLKYCFGLYSSPRFNKQELTETFDSIIDNEIQATENLNEIKIWCDLGEEVKQISKTHGFNHEFSYSDAASINISLPLVDMAEKMGEGNELDTVSDNLMNLKGLIDLGIDAEHFVYQACDSVIDYINEKHNLTGLEENSQRRSREEVKRSAEWIGIIESLQKYDQDQKDNIIALKEKFVNIENCQIPQPQQLRQLLPAVPENDRSPPGPGIYKFQTNIDESKLEYQSAPSFASTRNDINVGIHYGTYKGKEIVVKIYNINGVINDSIKSIENEIDVYLKLSEFSEQNPAYCYIKCYGVVISKQQIKIVLERYMHNLMQYIELLQEQKYVFEDMLFNQLAYKIVYSFYHMASLGIYHQDIKPHNFLVDQHWNIRIIDFNVSYIKIQDATLSSTAIFPIQGTEGYFSPEVQRMKETKEIKKFNIEKSDVYSLGLVFYQLLTYQSIIKKRNTQLHRDIEALTNIKQETKEFLKSMLAKKASQRSTFHEILTKINLITTTYQQTS